MDVIDAMREAVDCLRKESPPHERVLVMSKEQLEDYDKARPWNSIHERITNTKFSSEGKRRFGHRIYLTKEMI